jgi:glutamine amidotransferase
MVNKIINTTSYVTILDYGSGNINSIGRILNKINCNWILTKNPSHLLNASHIILPGVGHCGKTMNEINSTNIFKTLNDAVFINKVPVLGICLGMQLMTSSTEEGNIDCFGWFKNKTVELSPQVTQLKVPNIGWHTLNAYGSDPLLNGINLEEEPFYFCHRYGVAIQDDSFLVADLNYGNRYASILRRENIIGVQFHPEKSQDIGLKFFKNFLSLGSRSISV